MINLEVAFESNQLFVFVWGSVEIGLTVNELLSTVTLIPQWLGYSSSLIVGIRIDLIIDHPCYLRRNPSSLRYVWAWDHQKLVNWSYSGSPCQRYESPKRSDCYFERLSREWCLVSKLCSLLGEKVGGSFLASRAASRCPSWTSCLRGSQMTD